MDQQFIRGKKVIGCQSGGGLLKLQSLGEIFLNPDGTVELKPIELIPFADGSMVFRVGETTYWFGKDGEYEGAEIHTVSSDPLYRESVARLMKQAQSNFGKAPEPYFRE